MISARNADVTEIRVTSVEGKPTYGGELAVKPLIKERRDDAFWRSATPPGSARHCTPTRTESIAYVVSGEVKVDRRQHGLHHGTRRCLPGIPEACCTALRRSRTPWWWKSNRAGARPRHASLACANSHLGALPAPETLAACHLLAGTGLAAGGRPEQQAQAAGKGVRIGAGAGDCQMSLWLGHDAGLARNVNSAP